MKANEWCKVCNDKDILPATCSVNGGSYSEHCCNCKHSKPSFVAEYLVCRNSESEFYRDYLMRPWMLCDGGWEAKDGDGDE